MTVTNGYCTAAALADYLRGIDITAESDGIADAINAASREIDSYCGRRFYADTTNSSRTYSPRIDYDCCDIDDCISIASVASDDADVGTYGTTWTTSDYYTTPQNGVNAGLEGWPITGIHITHTGRYIRTWGRNPTLRISAKWGWSAVPEPVRQSSLRVAAALLKYRDAPAGIAGASDFGIVRMPSSELQYVQRALAPYRKMTPTTGLFVLG